MDDAIGDIDDAMMMAAGLSPCSTSTTPWNPALRNNLGPWTNSLATLGDGEEVYGKHCHTPWARPD